MKKYLNRWTSVVCAGAMVISMLPSANATSAQNLDQAIKSINESEPIETSIDYSIDLVPVDTSIEYNNGAKYDLYTTSQLADDSDANEYLWLDNILSDAEVSWENVDSSIQTYDLTSISMELEIPNADEIVDVSRMNDVYYIAYSTTEGEFVNLEYLPDGIKNRYIRESVDNEAEKLPTDADVIVYSGTDETVVRYEEQEASNFQARGATKVEFPTPSACGFTDTGKSGRVTQTKSVYINKLGKNLNARVVKYETNFRKESSGWFSFSAGMKCPQKVRQIFY